MNITFKTLTKHDIEHDIALLMELWNQIVCDGVAFPGEEPYEEREFKKLLEDQSAVTCILVDGEIAGFFILHPNNIGRCSHVANASYAISPKFRGKKLGQPLVEKSISQAKELGFQGMQYNAVVVGNKAAIHIYKKIGFQIIGTIPKGFRLKNGVYSDMHVMYLPIE